MKRLMPGLALALATLAGTAAETKVERLGTDLWRVRVSRDGTCAGSRVGPL